MNVDPIRGKTLRWTFTDGPMANKTFEHTFDESGSVRWCIVDGTNARKASQEKKYEAAKVGRDVYAVAYLGTSGYTLTTILDFKARTIVAFASNEKELVVQHGSFEPVAELTRPAQKRDGGHAHHTRH
jgi:hypothetical protein